MANWIGICLCSALLQELPEEPSTRSLYRKSQIVLCGEVVRVSDEFRVQANGAAFQFVIFRIINVYKPGPGEPGVNKFEYRGDACEHADEGVPSVLVLVQKEATWDCRRIPHYCPGKRYALFLKAAEAVDDLYSRAAVDGLWEERAWNEEIAREIENLSAQKRRSAASRPATGAGGSASRPADDPDAGLSSSVIDPNGDTEKQEIVEMSLRVRVGMTRAQAQEELGRPDLTARGRKRTTLMYIDFPWALSLEINEKSGLVEEAEVIELETRDDSPPVANQFR